MTSSATTQQMMPALTLTDLIVYEHNKVRALFSQYQATSDMEQRQVLCWELVREISQHAAKEEMVLYPALSALKPEIAQHCLDEHMQVKKLLALVDEGSVSDEGIAKQFEEAIQTLMKHIEEEETQFLPMLAKEVGEMQLKDMGMQFHCASVSAPTRPHPEAANQPPDNFKSNPKLLIADLGLDYERFGNTAHTSTPLSV